jgi:hypothetical protein
MSKRQYALIVSLDFLGILRELFSAILALPDTTKNFLVDQVVWNAFQGDIVVFKRILV